MKIKSLILSIALSLFAVSGLLAQDKYEYAILKHNFSQDVIVFITADNVEESPCKASREESTLLKKLNELSQKGWEVYNTTEAGNNSLSRTYYLRKKKN